MNKQNISLQTREAKYLIKYHPEFCHFLLAIEEVNKFLYLNLRFLYRIKKKYELDNKYIARVLTFAAFIIINNLFINFVIN